MDTVNKNLLLKNHELLGYTNENYKLLLFRECQATDYLLDTMHKLCINSFNYDGYHLDETQEKDQFDAIYSHLVLWDDNADKCIGSYRFAKTCPIINKYGLTGLYTSTLFCFEDNFQNKLMKGFELGRAFITPEYRKTYAMAYLWSGIMKYIFTEGDIDYIYGLLSIGGHLPSIAKAYLVYFYSVYFGEIINTQVTANHQYSIPEAYMTEIQSEIKGNNYREDFLKLTEQLNKHGCEIPTPLKHSMNFCEPEGIRLLAIGVDEDFDNCVDIFSVAEVEKIKPINKKGYKRMIHES